MYGQYCVRSLPDGGMLIRLHKRTGYYYRLKPVYVVVRLYEGRNLGPHNCYKMASGIVHHDYVSARKKREQIELAIQAVRDYEE